MGCKPCGYIIKSYFLSDIMRIDITSMFFNSRIEGQTATPAWGTSIGQNKTKECRIDDFKKDVVEIVIGMTYKSVSDLDKLDVSKSSSDRDIITCAVFNDVFVNNKKIDNAQYVLLLVREHSRSHDGRLIVCYAPYIGYNSIYNSLCIEKMQRTLGCSDKGCWFVYDISIKNQSELYFSAVVVNPAKPMIYNTTSQNRSKEWKSLIPENVESSINTILKVRPYITAIKSKPFVLLAGISGTGKSRIVRELARACWDEDSEEFTAQKPKNFEMVQVKPNWHDSSELIGYVSRINKDPVFVAGDFLKFIAKAWENSDIPYFLCLDEMNLAPVEQYFAEYLSVIESRKCYDNGSVKTDPILKKADEQWYWDLTSKLTGNDDIRKRFNSEGIAIPQNLIVVGTVNMDESTFSFSRKVLDRAMTIEMNDVDLDAGLTESFEHIGKLGCNELVGTAVEGKDVYSDNKDVCDKVLGYLKAVNGILEGTPFKVAYRTRNEFLLYVVNNLPYCKDEAGNDLAEEYVIARALDEVTNMKILSRIEGDDTKVTDNFLEDLKKTITEELAKISDVFKPGESVSLRKLDEMKRRLTSGYTSFWS